ncbi:MAG: tRNA glutamyl-Q(34) synthetase GluQRS [Myxococcota bacterium]|nr:tRNA glutamyl-Q(34) synthetase GluQRS [Myxococcota bacterium]
MNPHACNDAEIAAAGRFAPTPTGRLHLGNARTALLAWLSARSSGLRTILRVDDLDLAAMPKGCLQQQYADLDWLGLRFDEGPRVGGPRGPYRQSQRYALYGQTLQTLNERGLIYPCWCSRKEVQLAAAAPHASDEGPVYPGTCRPATTTTIDDLASLPVKRGRTPSLRINVAAAMAQLGDERLEFNDRVMGPQSYAMARMIGDFVVQRVDGLAAYQVACSVDDAAMVCGEVIRGLDLLPSTARQLLILRSLGLSEPDYGHVGLVVDHRGERLAKRNDAIALCELRKNGVTSDQVIRLLARLSGLPDTACLETLTNAFNPSTLTAQEVSLPPAFEAVQ